MRFSLIFHCEKRKRKSQRTRKMRYSFLIVLLFAYATAEFSLKRVSTCLNRKLAAKKFKKVKESPIYLNYGIIGLEALNVISPHQLKQIEYLSQCVQEEDASFLALRYFCNIMSCVSLSCNSQFAVRIAKKFIMLMEEATSQL
jgi:hypothetical protein